MSKQLYVLWMVLWLSGCRAFKPSADLQDFSSYFVKEDGKSLLPQGQVRVTFFGTSTLLFDDGVTQLLVDGFFSRPSVGQVAFGKVCTDTTLIKTILTDFKINRLGGIFVCHSHYDHAMDAPFVSKITGAKVYGSSSTLNICKGSQLPNKNMQEFEPGSQIKLGDFTVTVIGSKHTPPFKILGKTNATDPMHPAITEPLYQPAKADCYIEGGTFDFYIQHTGHAMLVKASTNYIPHRLDSYPADVFFLGTAMLGVQPDSFQQNYYTHTVRASGAKTIVPLHWDNFTKPISQPLEALPNISDRVATGFSYLIKKASEDSLQLKLMQGKSSIVLF